MAIKPLSRYSFGLGDRFAHQAKAQLKAIILAKEAGLHITPVWNKSYREHRIIGSSPEETRQKADEAVQALGWQGDYFVDADHIGLKTVDFFLGSSDFFTLDVADFIGQKADAGVIHSFVRANEKFIGELPIPGLQEPLQIKHETIEQVAADYLLAIREAGKIYRHILQNKGERPFAVEVSFDETEQPQSPVEILFILSALSAEEIPVQTIAPKFTGRFNKGIDYVGDLDRFRNEFEQDLAVIRFAVRTFNLPDNLKLSVHSGSDKFSLYPIIRKALQKFDAGLHLKTAGTTWLEELIGLAEAGGAGLEIAKEIYYASLKRFDELCAPYATVIDIDRSELPDPQEVKNWDGQKFAETLRHDEANPKYNPHFRQLLHVGYKVAAEMGHRFTDALQRFEPVIGEQVTQNIFDRHIRPLFLGSQQLRE